MKFQISRTRTVELVLVVDNAEYKKYGSRKTVAARMLVVVNHVDKTVLFPAASKRHSRSLPVPACCSSSYRASKSVLRPQQTAIGSINPSIPPFSPSYLTLHLSDLCCRSSGGSCRRRRYGGSCGRSAQHLQTSRVLCQLRLCPGIRPETPPPPRVYTGLRGVLRPPHSLHMGRVLPCGGPQPLGGLGLPRILSAPLPPH
ncbi:unnamed protein product [Boreogadus saida]